MTTKLSNLFYTFLNIAASTQKLGINLIRTAILIIFVWIGGLKFYNYEAEGIVPFVANSPFMSFFYTHDAPDYKEYKLKAEGQAGHSAFPEGAKNAIPLLLQQVMKLPGLSGEALSSLKPLYKLAASVNGTPAGINVQDSEFGNLTCCAVFLKWEDMVP